VSIHSRLEALVQHWQVQRGREFAAVGLDEAAFRASKRPLTDLPPRCLQAALFVDAYTRCLQLLDAEPAALPATSPAGEYPEHWADDERLWTPL
jgi:hypothetical protein